MEAKTQTRLALEGEIPQNCESGNKRDWLYTDRIYHTYLIDHSL